MSDYTGTVTRLASITLAMRRLELLHAEFGTLLAADELPAADALFMQLRRVLLAPLNTDGEDAPPVASAQPSSGWRSVYDLPDKLGADQEHDIRCVIVWRDMEHPSDLAVEMATLHSIRRGVYADKGRIHKATWRSVMDAPGAVEWAKMGDEHGG